MLEGISVYHASIRIAKEKVIYFDPYKIENEPHDADIIFITHSHYDHYSEEDIAKVSKDNTIIVMPRSMEKENDTGLFVEPEKEYEIKEETGSIKIKAISSYNILKPFHPKGNKWVGYVVELGDTKYYVAGDTDITNEAKNVKCDVAFLPCGGTYTMNVKEAVSLANTIKPKIAVPIHYGVIVGSKEDGEEFVKLLDDGIEGIVLQ